MTMVVAKFKDRWVQIAKFARDVKFSDEKDWFMIVVDWEKPFRKREQFKWIPASTRFEDVKEFVG